jgi:hypothetical protein
MIFVHQLEARATARHQKILTHLLMVSQKCGYYILKIILTPAVKHNVCGASNDITG